MEQVVEAQRLSRWRRSAGADGRFLARCKPLRSVVGSVRRREARAGLGNEVKLTLLDQHVTGYCGGKKILSVCK